MIYWHVIWASTELDTWDKKGHFSPVFSTKTNKTRNLGQTWRCLCHLSPWEMRSNDGTGKPKFSAVRQGEGSQRNLWSLIEKTLSLIA